jgi:hypothetical protein
MLLQYLTIKLVEVEDSMGAGEKRRVKASGGFEN